MYSNIILPRQWSRFACICRFATTLEGQKLPQNSASSDGILPPPRIPRGPTDILEALAATVGPDPTAPHYKYHDDPYLIPLSNFRKRSYALSAESGRRAATWIRDNHSKWFTTREWDPPGKMKTPHFNADPHIDAFAPKPIYTSESKVTENDLKYTIENALVEDSIQIYQLLGGAEKISEELKVNLLQLLCFYNEKEADSEEWLEEKWFSANTRERQAVTWRVGGLAETIFTSMEPKSAEAYCAVIQGMAKYFQAERAHSLAQEATEKGISLSVDVYNALLACIGFLKEGTSLRIDALKSILMEMEDRGITPNQETLSACLRSVSAWGGGKALQQLAMQLIAEFRSLGIDPGLSAYYYLLCLFCKERGPRVDILTTILNDLEKREKLEANEATVTNFFITAMGICSDHLQNLQLAERVHALLMKGDNYKLVGDAYKESIYYRHYVTVSCRLAPFEKTAELLDTLVPNVYVPEPSVMEEIIKMLELNGAGDRLAQAWSQLVIFGHAKRLKLVEMILDAMCNCYQFQDDEIKEKMRKSATDILKFGSPIEGQPENQEMRSPPPKLSATALCNIIELSSDVKEKAAEEWQTVSLALQRLRGEDVLGIPAKPTSLAQVAERAAAIGLPGISAMAVTYLAECGFEEAATASVKILGSLLNRDQQEVMTLVSQPTVEANLHPSAVALIDAYHMATSGGAPGKASKDPSSSDSESGSSSDEE